MELGRLRVLAALSCINVEKDVVALLCLLEGTDGGSKTTTAQAIKTAWDDGGSQNAAHIIHTGPPDPPGRCIYQEYEKQLDDKSKWILSQDHLIILDRWHLGDRIYGPRYRGFARYTEGGEFHTEMTLSSLGAVKVICSPPLEVVQERVKNRGDDYIDISDLPRIHEAYLNHGQRYGYYFYNGIVDLDDTIAHLLRDARYKAACARELADASAGTYTGSLHPQCIIAGDELGGTPEAQLRRGGFTRPFTPNSPATSGEWLMSALFKAGYLTSTALVNASDPGTDVAVIAKLRPEAGWVALGARASAVLSRNGISHRKVCHPAWHRRFRHAEHDFYSAELSQAIATAAARAALAPENHII